MCRSVRRCSCIFRRSIAAPWRANERMRTSMRCMPGLRNALSALQGGEGGDPLRSNGEGEVGGHERSGIPHLTPTLSAPPMRLKGGGEGVETRALWTFLAALVLMLVIGGPALAATPAPTAVTPEL